MIQHPPQVAWRWFALFSPGRPLYLGTKRASKLSHFSQGMTDSPGSSSPSHGHTANVISNIFALSLMLRASSQAEISGKLNTSVAKTHLLKPNWWETMWVGLSQHPNAQKKYVYTMNLRSAFEMNVSKQRISVSTSSTTFFWLIGWLR